MYSLALDPLAAKRENGQVGGGHQSRRLRPKQRRAPEQRRGPVALLAALLPEPVEHAPARGRGRSRSLHATGPRGWARPSVSPVSTSVRRADALADRERRLVHELADDPAEHEARARPRPTRRGSRAARRSPRPPRRRTSACRAAGSARRARVVERRQQVEADRAVLAAGRRGCGSAQHQQRRAARRRLAAGAARRRRPARVGPPSRSS